MSYFPLTLAGGIGGAVTGITLYITYTLSPKIYNYNSTKEILKRENLDKFFLKEMEYSVIVWRLRDMVHHPEDASFRAIALLLDDLRRSPFYDDAKYKPAYKNLWILQTNQVVKMEKSELHKKRGWFWDRDPCNSSTTFCTKADLLKELYVSLANDGDNLPTTDKEGVSAT
jgi:hypothetical protein